MNTMQKAGNFTDFVKESVENVVDTVERVHQTTLDMAVDFLKVVGLPEEKTTEAKEKQRKLVGSVYDAIRATNQQVGNMANEIVGGTKEAIKPSKK